MDKIKIGQIGVGHSHAAGKLAVYRASGDYEFVGVAELNADLRQKAESTAEYKGVTWLSAEQLLNTPGLRAVAVETQVRDLVPTAATCLAAGMHVHIDKPPGVSLPAFRQLLESAAKRHLTVQLGYMFRYSPAVQLLRQVLADGWLGEIFEIHTAMSKVVTPAARHIHAEFTGGMMFELGCHVIDLVVMILGQPQSVSTFHRRTPDTPDGLWDNMLAVAEYPGAVASIKSSALEVDGGARRHLVVCGREGTLHIQPLDEPNVQLALSQPRGSYGRGYQEVRFGNYPRYVGDAADLARIIREEKDADFGYQHDLAVHETVLRASAMPLDVPAAS